MWEVFKLVHSIYFDTDNKLRLSQGFPLNGQDLGEINFHINTRRGEPTKQVFLIMTDAQGLREIIELVYQCVDSNGKYKIYRTSLNQKVRLTSGIIKLQIMLLTPEKETCELSNELTLSLTTERYNLTRQVYLAADLGSKVQGYFEQIVNILTQLKEENEE